MPIRKEDSLPGDLWESQLSRKNGSAGFVFVFLNPWENEQPFWEDQSWYTPANLVSLWKWFIYIWRFMQIPDTETTLQAAEFTGNQRIPGAARKTLQNQSSPLQEPLVWSFGIVLRVFSFWRQKLRLKVGLDNLRVFFQPDWFCDSVILGVARMEYST